jgi:hypothetical protein
VSKARTQGPVVKTGVEVGSRRVDAVSPGGADQLGQALKNAEPLVSGRPKAATDLGNYVAQATVCGVGGSRTIYRSGGQGTHGPVRQGEPETSPHAPAVRSPNNSFPDTKEKAKL